jgi:hypothetical protein
MSDSKAQMELWTIGLLFFVAAEAGNWLITPMRHPDASESRRWAVVAQAVICSSVAAWLIIRRRVRARPARAG